MLRKGVEAVPAQQRTVMPAFRCLLPAPLPYDFSDRRRLALCCTCQLSARVAVMQRLAASTAAPLQQRREQAACCCTAVQPQQGPPRSRPTSQRHLQRLHAAQQQAEGQCATSRRASAAATAGAAATAAAAAAAVASSTAAPPLWEPGCASSSLSKDKLSKQQQEYLVNMGGAIRALQQDLPALLERQPNMDVFCEGVVFEDKISPRLGLPAASCSGKEAYGRLMWSLRFHRALFFCRTRVELLRMWEKPDEAGVVCVRWSARASPRLLDGLVATSSAAMSLDGVSEFHFDERSGLIMKHVADCVAYTGMQLQVPLLARYTSSTQRAMVPGLAGGSFDD